MCMEPGLHSIKSLTLSSYVVHSSPWAQNFITKLHKALSSIYLAASAQIACWLFHLKFLGFCNKDLPGCFLWRKWLCWSDAGHWHWRWCGGACCCSSWESLIKKLSWPCFLTAHRRAEGYWCLSCNFLGSVQPQNSVLDGVWHSLSAVNLLIA